MSGQRKQHPESAIALESVSYQIQGRQILREVSLDVRHGEILAVMGRSGIGKTTLLRLIMGLIRPQSGRILVDGEDIVLMAEYDLLPVRTKMGFVFQNAALFDSLTVRENVAFGLVERGGVDEGEIAAQVKEKIAFVGMEGTEDLYPAELSGGMRKRIGVARALVMQPHIMLYDEPTAGLDPPTAASLNELIVSLRDRLGVTSVIVSHDVPALAQVVERAAMLEDGRILATGSLDELYNSGVPEVTRFFLFWKQ